MNNNEQITNMLDDIKKSSINIVDNICKINENLNKKTNEELSTLDLIKACKALDYEEKKKVYSLVFGLGNLGKKIDNKLILISLIGSFWLKVRDKNMTIKEVVDILIDVNDIKQFSDHAETYKEILAIQVEEFVYGIEEGNMFGLSSAAELKAKVSEIMQQCYPF